MRLGIACITLALLVNPAAGHQQARGEFPRYCLTIGVKLRPVLRERLSVIDLTIENGSVVAVPRFPPGWELNIQNWVDTSPSRILGGATGSVAELGADDLKCIFIIEDSVAGAPPVKVTGSVYISTGTRERRVFLRQDQIVLERIKASVSPSTRRSGCRRRGSRVRRR